MTWLFRYRVREYVRTSLWLVPADLVALAVLMGPLVQRLDERTAWSFYDFGPEGARALVASLAGATFSLIVFVFSLLLLAVQMASAQLSPRIIGSTC